MIIRKIHLSRRTVLRGAGVALGLPLLDSMVPALGSLRAAAPASTRRMAVAYVPNGIQMEKWTPTADGASFEITPTLEPLRPFRKASLLRGAATLRVGIAASGCPCPDRRRCASAS